MTLWKRLQKIGLLRRDQQSDVTAECARFRADQAFQQYMDEARFNIINSLYALEADEVEKFKQLKQSQMALEGFENFIESAIISERMKERTTPVQNGR